ncbi:unnamed protein product [Durusdinium trenchii]|uniref:Uncharacterized protein n=1 Tax=Durusdinium trenchii TaxID=1381693 RepID=A0ABP0R383_9DINO
MIMGLADAVGASPFNLVAAASYLRDWVSERLTLQPPIDVSVLASPRLRGAVGSMDGAVAGAVVALEPNVSDVRVERASVSLPPQVVVDPRMEVICGMAKALHAEGSEWLHAFRKAYELWDKLNPNVRNALNVSEGSVQHEDVVGRDPLPLVEDQLEDDVRGRALKMAEIFSGSGVLAKEMEGLGFSVRLVDYQTGGEAHDISQETIALKIASELVEEKTHYVHFAPPCNTFSQARTKAYPMGVPGMELEPVLKVANAIIVNMCKMVKVLSDNHVLDQPEDANWSTVDIDYCMYGAPYKKRTRLLTLQWRVDPSEVDGMLSSLGRKCKRPSNGTSNRAPKKPKALDDLGDAVEKEKDVIATLPFWDTLMNQVDETFTKFGSISEFFMKSFPTLEERKALSQTLIDHFGATETLDSDFTAGIKSFGLWQICPRIEAGNKGLVINQFHKHLIMLILIQGPRTDAATSPGVEYPVIQPLVEAYFDTPWETSSLQAGTYDCQSIGFVKGWTRCVAALFAAHLLIQNDLVEHYRDHLPEAYKNFCLLKGLVTADYASELDRINANRDLTMGSVMTRAKPNCFNALHQIYRRLKQGKKLSSVVGNFDSGKIPKSIFGMGAQESGAIVNLVHHLPLECRAIFGNAVAEFGIAKGPVTHAAIAAPHIRVGYQPDLMAEEWSINLRNTEESVTRAAKRLVEDYRQAPPGLRKSATAPDVAKMARISRAFDLLLGEFAGKVPSSVFEAEKPSLVSLFENRVLDDYLYTLTEECPAQIDLTKVSEIGVILANNKAAQEKEAVEKSKVLHLQVQTATFQKMVNDLEGDIEALTDWVALEVKRKSSWQAMVLTHARRRYVRGLERVREFAEESLRVRAGALEGAAMELADFRSNLESASSLKCSPDSRFLLMVLDMSVPPNLSEIDALIRQASSILRNSVNNALLVLLPQRYSGQTVKSNLNATRRIEDALLSNGLNMDTDIAVHFSVDAMHGNDKRPLGARCRLCVSDKVPEGVNAWLSGVAARGKLEVPLLRIKEMKRLTPPNHIGDSVEAYSLSPAERCQQKGLKAAATIIETLISGTAIASPECRLDIVELNLLAVPDWIEAAWHLKYSWESDSGKPRIAYFGFARDLAVQKAVCGHMEAILMQEWWEGHPDAGPKEPDNSNPVEKPSLVLTSWDGEVPALSEVVICKFDGDEAYGEKWNGKVSSFRDFVQTTVAPIIKKSVGGSAEGGPGAVAADGPDMTVGDRPASVADAILPSVPQHEFQSSDVLFTVKPVRNLPALHITKDYDIYLSLDEATHKSTTLQLDPMELLGFNVGDVVPSEGDAPKPPPVCKKPAAAVKGRGKGSKSSGETFGAGVAVKGATLEENLGVATVLTGLFNEGKSHEDVMKIRETMISDLKKRISERCPA